MKTLITTFITFVTMVMTGYGQDVYVAGTDGSNAILWKNGVAQILNDKENMATAIAVCVSGDDVYVVGYEYEKECSVATIWKNGVAQRLGDGRHDTVACSVYVSGEDVYVVGYENFVEFIMMETYEPDSSEPPVKKANKVIYGSGAKFWKNGVDQKINKKEYGEDWENEGVEWLAEFYDVYVSNNDVYIVGQVFNYDEIRDHPIGIGILWKNGVVERLNNDNCASIATSISVLNGDVYIVGCKENKIDSKIVNAATLWKNGVVHILSDERTNASANSIYVSGDDIYVVGIQENIDNENRTYAVLWKNGVSKKLSTTNSNLYSDALSVYVLEDNTYIVGSDMLDGYEGICVPLLWVNDTCKILTGGSRGSSANSVIVK